MATFSGAAPVSAVSPDAASGVTSRSIVPSGCGSTSMPAPIARSAAIIRSESREARALRIREVPSARAASSR